jgi:hypothetical protein
MALMDHPNPHDAGEWLVQQNHAGSLRVLARDPFHDATDDLRTLTKPVGFEVVSTAVSDPHHCWSHADSWAKRPDLPLPSTHADERAARQSPTESPWQDVGMECYAAWRTR